MIKAYSVLILLPLLAWSCLSFQIPTSPAHASRLSMKMSSETDQTSTATNSRRNFLSSAFIIAASAVPTNAIAVMDNKQANARTFTAGQTMGKDEAIARFKLGRKDLQYLLDNYDSISPDGGDGVRRYLGTVGVTSGLYGISKVMKDLQKEADDIVEYTESMNEFNSYLNAADTACYSANFVEFSAAKTKPEKFLQDAKLDAQQMAKEMGKMAAELGI